MALSYFYSYTSRQPQGRTLEEIVDLIRRDSTLASLTAAYVQTRDKSVKEAGPLFGVAARFSGGKSEADITELTGLSLIDIDHEQQTGDGIEALRSRAMADPHTLLCYRTISGEGLRILFRYELGAAYSLEQQKLFYQKVFAAGNRYYERLLGVRTDWKCKNVGRLSGLAHDPAVYVNPEAVAFTAAEIEAAAQEQVQAKKEERKVARERKRIEAAYERIIRPEVEAEGGVYAAGSHNDYVMRVGYKLNQLGFREATATAWAVEMFPEYEATAAVLHSCYGKTEEFGLRRRRARAEGSRGDGSWASVEEIQQFLQEHVRLRHNVISGRVEWEQEMEGGQWEPITDRVVNSLWARMSASQRVNITDVWRVIESDFVAEYHPFRDYLERLGMQDSSLAISKLAATVRVAGGEEEQQRWERYLRKWIVGMVAGWLEMSVVNNVILVLIGRQGIYKTTWFQHLLPPVLRRYFYTKTNANRMGRDDLLTLAQYGLVCCEELDTMRPAELNQLKAAVTMTSIDERAAYAHFHEHRPHIASFCATGNNAQFLSDPTGNRRWLPFEVESICSPYEHPFDHDAVFAEAYALYRSGFRFWFSTEEIAELAEHNRRFETPNLELELVQQHFRQPTAGERSEFMPVATALQIVSGSISQKLSAVHLGRAFRELGFEQRVIKNVRGYIVVRYTAQEMEARRIFAAHIQ